MGATWFEHATYRYLQRTKTRSSSRAIYK